MAVSPASAAEMRVEKVTVVTASGRHVFSAEIADTSERRTVGLMNRATMADDAGMLFDFETTRPVTMWMKDTLIPLDMIFIRQDGTVAGFKVNAEPHSRTTVSAADPVRGVLELKGGTSARIGLALGDKIEHPIFSGQ